MKTLILLLFLSTVAWGQDWEWAIDSTPTPLPRIKTCFTDHVDSLIRVWDTYVKECYADSTRDTLDWARIGYIGAGKIDTSSSLPYAEWVDTSECCIAQLRTDSISFFNEHGNNNWAYISYAGERPHPHCCYRPILSEWHHRDPDPTGAITGFMEFLKRKIK